MPAAGGEKSWEQNIHTCTKTQGHRHTQRSPVVEATDWASVWCQIGAGTGPLWKNIILCMQCIFFLCTYQIRNSDSDHKLWGVCRTRITINLFAKTALIWENVVSNAGIQAQINEGQHDFQCNKTQHTQVESYDITVPFTCWHTNIIAYKDPLRLLRINLMPFLMEKWQSYKVTARNISASLSTLQHEGVLWQTDWWNQPSLKWS